MDDLEKLIAKTMEATQRLQEQQTRKHTPVQKTELMRQELTVEQAVAKIRCIPDRFRSVVTAMLVDGVPPAIAELTPTVDLETLSPEGRVKRTRHPRFQDFSPLLSQEGIFTLKISMIPYLKLFDLPSDIAGGWVMISWSISWSISWPSFCLIS